MAKKAILVPYARANGWTEECFPGRGISVLPVAGKPFVEYQLDALAGLGVESVLVLDYEYEAALANHLAGGGRKRWPFELAYQGAGIFKDESEVRTRHAAFIGSDGEATLVVIGMRFPKEGAWVEIDSLRAYYDLNFHVLKHPESYTLDGYSSEKDVHLGMNVMIKTGHPITTPVFLGDGVRIEFGVRLLGDVIVGRGSSIDQETTLSRSIIFPNTYVGRKMEIEGKIVTANRILDPESGVFVDLDDLGLSSEQHLLRAVDWLRVLEYVLALVLTAFLTPVFLVWFPFSLLFGRGVWSYRLSMDRYPRLWKALFFRARLVRTGPSCTSWVFRAADGLIGAGVSPEATEIEDAWFAYNRTARVILGIACKGLVRRLLSSRLDYERDR